MHFRRLTTILVFTAIACLSSLSNASVPGSGGPPDSLTASLRIFQVQSLEDLPQAEREAAFAAYVEAVRAALAQEAFARAEQMAERAVILWPELRRPQLHLATARLHAKKWGPAIEAARHAQSGKDDDMPPEPHTSEGGAAAAYWEGLALYQTQRYDEALPRLRAAVDAAPNWAEAARALGEAAFVAGKMEEAASAYAAAFGLEAQAGDVRDLSYYSEAMAATGDLENGIAALQAAIERGPYVAGLHANLGNMLRREQKLAEAYYHFTLELLIHGTTGEFASKSLTAVGEILEEVSADENHPNRHEMLLISAGLAGLREGDAHRAVHSFEHAARISRTATAVPRILLAEAFLSAGKAEQARTELEKILSLEPDFVPALVLLAESYRALGDRERAQSTVERAFDLFPDYWKLKPEMQRG